jgi:diguanylate cyclase (GGDEF)-like protein/PAS domain S-box-containing protein
MADGGMESGQMASQSQVSRPMTEVDRKFAEPLIEPLRSALFDSRQRWREFVLLTADFVFETDMAGRFTFIGPDPAFGWSAPTLLGRSGSEILAEPAAQGNVFVPVASRQRRQVWLRRHDGSLACLRLTTAPMTDGEERIVGLRGSGVEITEEEDRRGEIIAALRRNEVIDHILWHVRQEILAANMARAGLGALCRALGADGGAVIDLHRDAALEWRGDPVRHQTLDVPEEFVELALEHLCRPQQVGPMPIAGPLGERLLVSSCAARLGGAAAVLLWRGVTGREWEAEDRAVMAAAVGILRLVLEQESIQQDMARQARTDPLTGLFNRRAFVEEVERRIARLDRESLPGTLIFVDVDNFKSVNDRLGHEAGDQALIITATLLRATVRPTDLVARFGGDEFALWLDGADEFSASERAAALCERGPSELAHLAAGETVPISLSIGIATRWPNEGLDLDHLMRRADQAMYDVKRTGRGRWRVARAPRDGEPQ